MARPSGSRRAVTTPALAVRVSRSPSCQPSARVTVRSATRPEASIRHVAEFLGRAHIRALEVATFYTMCNLQPVGKFHVQFCGTTPCRLRGAGDILEVCQSRIHHEPFHLSRDGNFSWEEVECLGACVNAPMVLIWNDTYEDLTAESFGKVLDGFAKGQPPKPGPQIDRQLSAPIGGATTLKSVKA